MSKFSLPSCPFRSRRRASRRLPGGFPTRGNGTPGTSYAVPGRPFGPAAVTVTVRVHCGSAVGVARAAHLSRRTGVIVGRHGLPGPTREDLVPSMGFRMSLRRLRNALVARLHYRLTRKLCRAKFRALLTERAPRELLCSCLREGPALERTSARGQADHSQAGRRPRRRRRR